MKFSIVKNDYQQTIKLANEVEAQAIAKGWTLDDKNPDIVLVVGGDGTFLTAVSKYNKQLDNIKFYPILSGGIGFYTNHTQTNSDDRELNIDNTCVQDYDLLEVNVNNDVFYAINEVKIVDDIKPLHLLINVNDSVLEQFSGTGLIFSTSTGSTGVMKSSGGAIIYPNNGLFEMNELSPVSTVLIQTINAPIIFDKQSIKVSKINPGDKASLIIDSKIIIDSFENIEIKLSNKKVKVLRDKQNLEKAEVLKDIFVTNK